jgi:hypothetical protein
MRNYLPRTTLALLLATALIGVGTALAASPTVIRSGNLVLAINGSVAPQKLPRAKLAPIKLRASGRISTADGSQPPAAKYVAIDFDKHGTINAKGLSSCRAGQLVAQDPRHALGACKSALVGTGRTQVRVEFAESKPFYASGPLHLFNGGVRHGVTTMYIHAYVAVPVLTALVTTVKIHKVHNGPFGTRAVARIPKIAGGSGSLTNFHFLIHRTFKRSGRRQSYLLARCANGRFRAHAVIITTAGRIAGSIQRACHTRG